MDKWTETQVDKIRKGGNEKCRIFFESQEGYSREMPIAEKYTTHFASQYKEKVRLPSCSPFSKFQLHSPLPLRLPQLLSSIEGRPFLPTSAPPAPPTSTLRKPRTGGPTSTSRGPSPSGRNSPLSPSSAGGISNPYNPKARNEDYFSGKGAENERRREDLPPSQGGKYAGFGSDSPGSGGGGGWETSSRAIPSFGEMREDPVSALGRGWGFLGAALSQASKTINESVLQPTLTRATDPALTTSLTSYVTQASTALSSASRASSQALAAGLQTSGGLIRREIGVDVGDLGAGFVEGLARGRPGTGYAAVGAGRAPTAEEEEEGDGQGDFFEALVGAATNAGTGAAGYGGRGEMQTATTSSAGNGAMPIPEDGWAKLAPQSVGRGRNSPAPTTTTAKKAQKKDDDWEGDFGGDWDAKKD